MSTARNRPLTVFTTTVFVIAVLLLFVLNVYAWRAEDAASKDLAQVEQFDAERLAAEIAGAKLKDGQARLRYLVESFRTPELVDVLKKSIETSGLDAMLVLSSQTSSLNTYYLYAPDASQTLIVDLVFNRATAKTTLPFAPHIKWDKDVQTIELPLVAARLHEFSFGVQQVNKEDRFRVLFDGKEVLGDPLKNYRSGSTFRSHANVETVLCESNCFLNEREDFASAIKSGHWLQFVEMTFSYRIKSKTDKQIGIRARLRGEGPLSIKPEMYWDVERKLELKWDEDSGNYQILGLRRGIR